MKPYITVTLLKSGVTAQIFVDKIVGVADPDPNFEKRGAILLLGASGSAEVRDTRSEIWDKIIDAAGRDRQGVS